MDNSYRTSLDNTIYVLEDSLWLLRLVVLDGDRDIFPEEILNGLVHQLRALDRALLDVDIEGILGQVLVDYFFVHGTRSRRGHFGDLYSSTKSKCRMIQSLADTRVVSSTDRKLTAKIFISIYPPASTQGDTDSS